MYNIVKPEEFTKNEERWIRIHDKNCDFPLNLDNPKLLSDKMTFCDIYFNFDGAFFRKDKAKQKIAEILGTEDFCVPTYQICGSIDEIDFENLLGKSFVIKPAIGAMSRGVYIHKKKLKESEIKPFKQELKSNIYLSKKKSFVVEKYIGAKNSTQQYMRDYKFWCFNGKPFCVLVCDKRNTKTHKKESNFYDLNFKKMLLQKKNDCEIEKKIAKPKNFSKMIEIVSKISKDMPVVRVDLYNVGGKIYFGECQKMYSFHCKFKDMSFNEKLSYLLDISDIETAVDAAKYKKTKEECKD